MTVFDAINSVGDTTKIVNANVQEYLKMEVLRWHKTDSFTRIAGESVPTIMVTMEVTGGYMYYSSADNAIGRTLMELCGLPDSMGFDYSDECATEMFPEITHIEKRPMAYMRPPMPNFMRLSDFSSKDIVDKIYHGIGNSCSLKAGTSIYDYIKANPELDPKLSGFGRSRYTPDPNMSLNEHERRRQSGNAQIQGDIHEPESGVE